MTPDRVPSAEMVAEEFGCSVLDGCTSPEECWTGGRCRSMARQYADPRPGARKRDSDAMRRALLRHRECACGRPASDGHHVLFRSSGGDDVPENIRPLCHDCHMAYHANDAETLRLVGEGLLPENVAYVLQKLGVSAGQDYLRRRYALFIPYREARAIASVLKGA